MKDRAFHDRADAGEALARQLATYADRDDVLVLALPLGGVPVGYEVARALRAPLDVFLVRKLSVAGREEQVLGAIASGGVRVLNEAVIRGLAVPDEDVARVAADEQQEIERQDRLFRAGGPEPDPTGRTVLLVDDGLATGSTMRAAVAAVRAHEPDRLVVAVPVAAREACDALRGEVDDLVCVHTPEPFGAIERWYEDFEPIPEEEVRALLDRAGRER